MRNALAGGLFTLVACGVTPPPAGHLPEPEQLSRTIDAPVEDVVAAAAAVLADWGFGVATVNERMGILQTSEKTLQGAWRNAGVRDYVYCGKLWDSGVEIALSSPVTITIGINAREQPEGTLVRLNVNGSAEHAGYGASPTRTYPCEPTSRMAGELLGEISALAAR